VADGDWVAAAVIVDPTGRAFVQRRAHDRQLFPGCWDIVGGHVESGEDVLDTVIREIHEETGWQLAAVHACIGIFEWTADGRRRQEVDYLVSVDGELSRPRLELAKHPESSWITAQDLVRLDENRAPGDTFIRDVVASAIDLATAAAVIDPGIASDSGG